jgi:hypothetical protein
LGQAVPQAENTSDVSEWTVDPPASLVEAETSSARPMSDDVQMGVASVVAELSEKKFVMLDKIPEKMLIEALLRGCENCPRLGLPRHIRTSDVSILKRTPGFRNLRI